ncbi:MAG: AMP-binding protein [Planctomycetaceae bacterium]|nr:AMP-binding protein [Planctomycetaceae bacterium]
MPHPEDLHRRDLEQRQRTLLNALLKDIFNTNRFWQPRLQAAEYTPDQHWELADLSRLPTLKKSELVADQASSPPYGTNLTRPLTEYTRLHQTSGTTTGRPLRWLDTPRTWAALMQAWKQTYRLMDLRPDDRCCFPFSFGPFLGFWAGFEAAVLQERFSVAAGGMSSEARLQLIAENDITLLGCTPTYALRLAEVAAKTNIDLHSLKVRTILVAGEPGGNVPATRRLIETAWNARVVDHWGMSEIGPLGIEAAETPGSLTILETECIAEILHLDRDEAVTPGELGELVVTTLSRGDMPVLRYRTGDLVQADLSPAPSGRCLLRLAGGIRSRVDDMLVIRGNNVFPASIEAVVREFPAIVEFRIVVTTQRAMTHVRLEIETDSAADDVTRQLMQAVKGRLNFQPEVVAVPAGSLPRFEMKAQRVVRESGD